MSVPIWEAMMELRSFLFDKVYTSDQVMREVYKARHLVEDLFNYFVRHYDEVPGNIARLLATIRCVRSPTMLRA